MHPESYPLARQVLAAANVSPAQLGSAAANQRLQALPIAQFTSEAIGEVTVKDVIDDLMKPGRDLRDTMPAPLLRQDVLTLADLKPGMQLQGTVRNVVDFGAFVDIGVKHDGLVHISRLTKQFVNDPRQVVAVGDIVTVWVQSVDLKRERIQLTMLAPND